MPEVPGSWPEEGSPYQPGAPMEPVQQSYQQQQQYQQPYPQQSYGQSPQYPAGQQQPYGQPQQAYPEQAAAQQAMFGQEEQASVPSEFDHLFRDSVPTDRRSISRQAVVGAAPPAAGFAQAAQAQPQPAATAMFTPQQEQAPGYPQAQPAYGGPGQGYGGAGYDPLPPRPGRSRTPLVIGGVVVVVAAVGLYLGLSGGGSGTPSSQSSGNPSASSSAGSKQSAQQEADALYQLVTEAKDLRSDANGGVSALVACNIPVAKAEINSAVTGRQAALNTLAKLDVSKIDGGTALAAALNKAWHDSYTSDNDYAKAVADFDGGATCSAAAVKADPNYAAASQGSSESTQAKQSAAKLWNQAMPTYGKPQITSAQL
ncbi:hypothetical protein [Actinospica robiniae]|uniref:hypothetical protein n=1 Tax=Actinospica robiniae TaxID=304901 RepID=UPI0012FA27A2|nr:hypothetical protein [Actinospica robiniae]